MKVRNHWRILIPLALLLLVSAACSPQAAPAPAKEPVTTATNLILMVDMVLGSKNLPADQKEAKSCVLNSRFPRNSQVVWRARVYDPRTGEVMSGTQLKSVQVRLANGQTVDMKFGPHPKNPPNEEFWTGSWVVPKDQATGTLGYTVLAESADGRTGEFKPFITATSLLTIIDETFPDPSS